MEQICQNYDYLLNGEEILKKKTNATNALCVKPLRNLGIQGFAKMNPSAPIFPTQNYFR